MQHNPSLQKPQEIPAAVSTVPAKLKALTG